MDRPVRPILDAVLLASVTLAWFVPLEWAARAHLRTRGDALDQAQPLLKVDAELGWRQRERLSGTLAGEAYETDDLGLRNPRRARARGPAGRVVVLGPSSAFGWGVPESETYARRLEGLLAARFPGAAFEVVNAGQVGFTAWQGLRFYESRRRLLKADLVVLAYGANDVDRFRFFLDDGRPDSAALARPMPAWSRALLNGPGRLASVRWASRRASALRQRFSCPRASPPVPGLRVPPEEFKASLRSLAGLARAGGARVALVSTAFLLPPPGDSPRRCEKLYQEAAALAGQGLCREAADAFNRARREEPGRIARDLAAYNILLRDLARELRTPLVDAAALLGNDPGLFADPIHPSGRGHAVIAQALLETVVRDRLLP